MSERQCDENCKYFDKCAWGKNPCRECIRNPIVEDYYEVAE